MDSYFGPIEGDRRQPLLEAVQRTNLVLFACGETCSGRMLEKIDALTGE